MIGIDTCRVKAFGLVMDGHITGNWSIKQHEGNAMSVLGLPAVPHLRVTVLILAASPDPTFAFDANTLEELDDINRSGFRLASPECG